MRTLSKFEDLRVEVSQVGGGLRLLKPDFILSKYGCAV